jgi:AhpD family alkylhydroperoxidase
MNFMTTTGDDMHATAQTAVRLDFDAHAPGFAKALSHLDKAATRALDAVDFDPKLRELIRVRASQLNGCAYCIDMHTKDARVIGETEQRLYALPAWEETPFFSDRERAALAFTETVTLLAVDHVPAKAFAAAGAEFSAAELAAMLSLIVTINAWNTIGATTRAWMPGSYRSE